MPRTGGYFAARRIAGFHELDGLEFLARVDVEKDAKGGDRNVVKLAVEPDHPDYARLMGVPTRTHGAPSAPTARAAATPAHSPAPASAAPARAPTGKPAWAS